MTAVVATPRRESPILSDQDDGDAVRVSSAGPPCAGTASEALEAARGRRGAADRGGRRCVPTPISVRMSRPKLKAPVCDEQSFTAAAGLFCERLGATCQH